MNKKIFAGGVILLILGVLFVVLVQFVLMPTGTEWTTASSELENSDVNTAIWVTGKITSEDQVNILGMQEYAYKLDNVDHPTIYSSVDIGNVGDNVLINVKKTSAVTYEVSAQAKTPPIFYIGILLLIVGIILAILGYLKGRKEELPPSTQEEETF